MGFKNATVDNFTSDIGMGLRKKINPVLRRLLKIVTKGELIVDNYPKLEEDVPYIFVSTHNFVEDTIANLSTIDRNAYLLFGTTDQLEVNPEMYAAWLNGFIYVDRENPQNRKDALLKMQRVLENGNSVLIFAEGGFNNTENLLCQKLFASPYILSKVTGAKVVPIAPFNEFGSDKIYMNYEYISKHKESYDVIFSYYNLDAVFVPKDLINKNVLYLCGIPREQNDFQGSFLSVYDDVLAISDEVKESWKKYCKKEVEVISTGVDCDRFLLKNIQNVNSEEIVLLYVGRLISRKNVDNIIYAFERLRAKYNVKLLIVGDGPDKKHLESISNDCVFTGVVTDTENYYKQADIFISPSAFGEGLQGTILEAMSCGLTIVATNTKINKQLLSNGRGILVEPSVESIVEGLEKAIDMDRVEIAKKNRKYVLDNYSWLNKTNEILEVLKWI